MSVRGITAGDEVELAVLEKAFRESGLTLSDLARRLGWTSVRPNTSAVARALGLRSDGYGRQPRRHTNYQKALILIEAMGLDPVDYGL